MENLSVKTIMDTADLSRAMAKGSVSALRFKGRAHMLAWAIETILGIMFFVILFGQVAYPMYQDVSTSGWDEYTLLLWGFLMFLALAAFVIRVIQSAKEGYTPIF